MNTPMNYTPQQQMGCDSYSVPCRVGNWTEDEYMGALMTAEHVAKASSGMLSTQKLQDTVGATLAPVELSTAHPDGMLRFGDAVMLSNAQGGVLAMNAYSRKELSQMAFEVSRTPDETPRERTCFSIQPYGDAPEDGLLRFGMPFMLVAKGCGDDDMYLQSMRYTISNMNYSRSVRGAERKQGVSMVLEPSWQVAWEVVLLNPMELEQLRSEGQPVPANTFLAIRHKSTQTNLCSDTEIVRNHYGTECEVSGFTDVEVTKSQWGIRNSQGVGVSNHWAFTTAAPPEA